MTDRRTLLLAYGIAEWDSALKHIRTLGPFTNVDVTVAIEDIEEELDHLKFRFVAYWHEAVGHHPHIPDPVEWARRYCTAYQTELNQLLAEETHDQTEVSGPVG